MIALYILGSLLLWLVVATGCGVLVGKGAYLADQHDAEHAVSERVPA